ncbi:MAG: SH3 domain-containing protein, partial [bacterium]|nr:SH3 domain-containing protein [bacterium]
MNKKKIATYLAVIISLCLVIFAITMNRNEAYATTKGKVNANSLNVRTGTGTNYSVLTSNGSKVRLNKQTAVTILSEKNGWYRISFKFNKKTLKGYVLKKYITLTNTSDAKATSTSNTVSSTSTKFKIPAKTRETLRVRTGAGTNYSQLTVSGKSVKLSAKQKITILNEKMVGSVKWYYVSFTYDKKTRYGWVSGEYVQLTLSSTVNAYVRTSTYKIRTAQGTSASYLKVSGKVVSLKKNASIKILKEKYKNNKRWYYVSFTYNKKTRYGYIYAVDVYFNTTVTATPTK